jgi:hypothetical protein
MQYDDRTVASLERLTSAALSLTKAMNRGDAPPRISDIVDDVSKWAANLKEDVNSKQDTGQQLPSTNKPVAKLVDQFAPNSPPNQPKVDMDALQKAVTGDVGSSETRTIL